MIIKNSNHGDNAGRKFNFLKVGKSACVCVCDELLSTEEFNDDDDDDVRRGSRFFFSAKNFC